MAARHSVRGPGQTLPRGLHKEPTCGHLSLGPATREQVCVLCTLLPSALLCCRRSAHVALGSDAGFRLCPDVGSPPRASVFLPCFLQGHHSAEAQPCPAQPRHNLSHLQGAQFQKRSHSQVPRGHGPAHNNILVKTRGHPTSARSPHTLKFKSHHVKCT